MLLALVTVFVASCTRYIDDARPVAAAGSGAAQCDAVDAPLTTIPARKHGEPVMKIPQPQGWARTTMMDSELIRFAMANKSITKAAFAPNAVVTVESARGVEDPGVVFDGERNGLQSAAGATDLRVTEHTLCGLPAETVRFQIPAIGNVGPHPGIAVFAVIHTDGITYAATVTLQTTDGDDPTYQRDADMILRGFQLLPPSPN